MPFVKISKNKNQHLVPSFNNALERWIGFRYPPKYLSKAEIFGWLEGGEFKAGVVFFKSEEKNFRDLRSLGQIPWLCYANDVHPRLSMLGVSKASGRVWELNGYFIADKAIASRFLVLASWEAIKLMPSWIFGARKHSDRKLAFYYGHGRPIRVYEGAVEFDVEDKFRHIVRMKDFEIVEAMRPKGLLSVVLWRLRRTASKRIKKLFSGVYGWGMKSSRTSSRTGS